MDTSQKELTNDKRPLSLLSQQNIYLNPPSRDSMDLIEGASQMLPQNAKHTESDARQQRQRWDAFFEPHYSFGSFVHGSKKDDSIFDDHQKHLDRLVDEGCRIDRKKSPRPDAPTLPGSVATSVRISQDGSQIMSNAGSIAPTPTLPNLEYREDGTDRKNWSQLDEKSLIQRLELLKKIRTQGLDLEERQESDVMSLSSQTARWKKQKKSIQKLKDLPIDDDDRSSSSDPDLKPEMGEEEVKKIPGHSRPFLYFLLGFIFPPFWFLGAFYTPSHSSTTRRSDRIWKRRSRIAFALFLVILMVFLIVALVLKPDTVGMRQSRPGGMVGAGPLDSDFPDSPQPEGHNNAVENDDQDLELVEEEDENYIN